MSYISFFESDVLHYLINKNEVYTVRDYPAEKLPGQRSIKTKFGFIGKVTAETVGKPEGDGLLAQYCEKSGFLSVQKWKEAIERQHKKKLKDRKQLWLLKATVVKLDPIYLIECRCGYKVLEAEKEDLDWCCPYCGCRFEGAPYTRQTSLEEGLNTGRTFI